MLGLQFASVNELLQNKRTLIIQKGQLMSAQRNLELARERENLLDISNAEIQVNQTEDTIIRAEQSIQRAQDSLKSAMGFPILQDITVSTDINFTLGDVDPVADAVWSLANNEEFLNLGLREEKQSRDERILKQKRLPDVSVDGRYRRVISDSFDIVDGEENTSIGLSIDWEWLSESDRARFEKAKIRGSLLAVERFRREQDKTQTIRNLGRRLDELRNRIRLREQEVALQERRLALYEDRYNNGEIDILEYIRNQNQLDNSRVSLVNQRADYLSALAEYRFQVGK